MYPIITVYSFQGRFGRGESSHNFRYLLLLGSVHQQQTKRAFRIRESRNPQQTTKTKVLGPKRTNY
jgi:hypothetical protein